MGIYLSKANVEMETEEGRGNGMQYCVGDIQGWRKNMEDAHLASLEVKRIAMKERGSVAEKEDMSIFGVFDGHGGKEVAKFTQIKFIREFVRGKAFAEQRDALRTAFHRIDDMLEDERYDTVLNKLKSLPNPSDAKQISEDDDDDDDDDLFAGSSSRAKKSGYNKFNPHSSEYDSESELQGSEFGTEGKSGADTSNSIQALADMPVKNAGAGAAGGAKNKKKITREEALELFTQLILKENKKAIGVPSKTDSRASNLSAAMAEREDSAANAVDRINRQEWESYYRHPTRQPGDLPRPTLHKGPASEGMQCRLREHRIQAGCTSIVAFRVGNLLYCANAGDSRGVLCRGDGQVHALSEDHKPSSTIELSRIEKAGGFVNVNGRINGNLNLSRSLGDMKYKQVEGLLPAEQMITAEPDISVTEILPTDKFFVLACDGVWDVLTNQAICDFVSERLFPTGKPLQYRGNPDTGDEGHILAEPMSIKQIVRDVFCHCVADDPKRTQGVGGDNMTCMIVLLNQ